jgi:hypothetical protein
MRRYQRYRTPGTTSRPVVLQLMSRLTLLLVVAMMVYRFADPGWLRGLDGDAPPAAGAAGKDAPPAKPADRAARQAPQAPAVEPEAAVTDQDPEEAEAFRDERQAITDKTLEIQREEMNAYSRVLHWVENQSFAAMQKRARADLSFTDLVHSPEAHRGELVALRLNVRLLRKIPNTRDGVQLYEAWGPAPDSGMYLYDTIVVDRPAGMPLGEIDEQARFVGYFFKVQGYHPALSKPSDLPLPAPVLIGRLDWRPSEKPQIAASDWLWGAALVGGVLTLALAHFGLMFLRHRRRTFTRLVTSISPTGGPSMEDWLQQAQLSHAPHAGGEEISSADSSASEDLEDRQRPPFSDTARE